MNNEIFLNRVETSFKKYFPMGHIQTDIDKSFLTIRIGLIGDIDRVTNRIRENDPMRHVFIIHIHSDGMYEAVCLSGGLAVKPRQLYWAMSILKTPWRKKTADAEKVFKAFDTFFGKLYSMVVEEGENIYGYDKIADLVNVGTDVN